MTWHRRLGHTSTKTIRRMARVGAVEGLIITDTELIPCEACLQGKMTRNPIRKLRTTIGASADVICHSDLCGPFRRSIHGSRYLMLVAWKGYLWSYFLRHKSDASAKMAEFLAQLERQLGVSSTQLKVVRTDGGGEFTSRDFRELCLKRGLRLQTSHAHSPFENGVAERANRTVCDMAATLLIDSKLPHSLWEHAVRHAVHLHNRVLHKRSSTMTPYEAIYREKPIVQALPVFGDAVMVHVPAANRTKNLRFTPRAIKAAFVGFEPERKGIFAYSRTPTPLILTSRDYKLLGKPLMDRAVADDYSDSDETPETDDDESVEIDASHFPSRAAIDSAVSDGIEDFLGPDVVAAINGSDELTAHRRSERLSSRKLSSVMLAAEKDVIVEPRTMAEAKRSKQWPYWQTAIRRELAALEANNTWPLMALPRGERALANTVQFRIKLGEDPAVLYKARVCARGDLQTDLFNAMDVYAPVATLTSLRLVFAIAVKYKLHLRQGDVPSAYVKAPLKTVVYLRQVRGFEVPGKEHFVLKLHKALYGLRQAGADWHAEIDAFLRSLNLYATTADKCLYYFKESRGMFLLLLYVDDILIAYEHLDDFSYVFDALQQRYGVKDLGFPQKFLGMEIVRHEDGSISLRQQLQIAEILHRFGMDQCAPSLLPIIAGTRFERCMTPPTPDEVEAMRAVPYRQLIGALLYVSRMTRPDIAFVVNQAAQVSADPRPHHWRKLLRVLQYLRCHRIHGIRLCGNDNGITAYSDADWANDLSDRRSVSGVVVQAFGSTIHWLSKKQTLVTKSSTAAELVAADLAAEEALWVKSLLEEIMGKAPAPRATLFIDNKSTIARVTNNKTSGGQKTIDVRFHYLRDAWQDHAIAIEHCPSTKMPADALTKALARPRFTHLNELMGLTDTAAQKAGASDPA